MLNKKVITILFTLMLMFNFSTAQAWYVELTNVDGTLTGSGLYTMDLYFYGDVSTDILNSLFVNISYDTSKLKFAAVDYNQWLDPTTYQVVWDAVNLHSENPVGMLNSIGAAEDAVNVGNYTPMATELDGDTFAEVTPANKIATIKFIQQGEAGTFTDLATFFFDPVIFISMITMNGYACFDPNADYFYDDDLVIGKTGSSATLSPVAAAVPVPGTAVLLAFGMAGLLGLRRRRA